MKTPVNLTIPERKALRLVVLCLALLGGAGLFLGLPNPVYQLPPLVLLFPACLATLARIMPTARGGFFAGWLCAAIGNGACLYWVSIPMHDYGLVPWLLTLPAVLALGAYLGFYGGLFSLLYRLFRERLPFAAALLLVCPLWAAIEIAKEYLFTGFPWVSPALAFMAWPEWVQAASIVGGNVLSGIFALAAVAIAEARPVRVTLGYSPEITPKKRSRRCLALAAASLLAVFACAYLPPLPEGRSLTVGLVQGNIDQNQKWDPAYQVGTLSRYLTLSEWAVNPSMGRLKTPVDLVIWPETSMPFYFEANPGMADRIIAFTTRFSVPLVFGAPGKSDRPDGKGFYNRMWLETPIPFERQSYDKMQLVPFGEYVPLGLALPFLEHILQGLDFLPGTSAKPLKTDGLALGGLICYEAIFSGLAQNRVANGANLLVNISNDAWFGDSPAPVQHLYLTAMRAVEQGRYIARATNTGISAVITPRGTISARSALFRSEMVVGTVRLVDGLTPFHTAAPFLLWGSVLISLAAAGICLAKGRKQRDSF